jgi:hypothetical protein
MIIMDFLQNYGLIILAFIFLLFFVFGMNTEANNLDNHLDSKYEEKSVDELQEEIDNLDLDDPSTLPVFQSIMRVLRKRENKS